MQIIKRGHVYNLSYFEMEKEVDTIQFINKETVNGELRTIHDGTTNEEVLKMLIDRMQFLQGEFPCRENAIVITKLEESLMWLEHRTKDRTKRGVEGQNKK